MQTSAAQRHVHARSTSHSTGTIPTSPRCISLLTTRVWMRSVMHSVSWFLRRRFPVDLLTACLRLRLLCTDRCERCCWHLLRRRIPLRRLGEVLHPDLSREAGKRCDSVVSLPHMLVPALLPPLFLL